MPEKALWPRNVGMEPLNSVGSTGSCDSMESISSNHSAFSGDGYDHLSAEERECLMFLEETIDSLDNENDSGLSNDELETTENRAIPEPIRIPQPNSNDKTSPKATLSKSDEWANVSVDTNKIPQGYHSFPRVIQAPREELAKHSTDSKLAESNMDPVKPWHGKHKSLSSINHQTTVQSPLPEFLILPPEPFRDPQIIDKRRSVTDPTDAREVRFDRAQFKSAKIPEHKEVASNTNTPFPRVLAPSNTFTGSQQNINQSVDFRQGPPTAPKPRTLPPHIIIKTSGGAVTNLDPVKRSRAFSAHERGADKANESIIPKALHSKEHEKARHEALQKLGLEEKPSSQENSSIRSSKTDLSPGQGLNDQCLKDSNRRSTLLNPQERLEPMGSTPVQPSIVIHKPQGNVKNEGLTRNRLSMKSDEPMFIPKDNNIDGSSLHSLKSGVLVRNRSSVKANPKEESEGTHTLAQPSIEDEAINSTPKHVSSDTNRNLSLIKSVPPLISDNVIDKPVRTSKDTHSGLDIPIKNPKHESGIKSSSVKANSAEISTHLSETNPLPVKTNDQLTKPDKPQEKVGSLENISIISTSPGKTFIFPRPKEVSVTQHSPEVIRRDGRDRAATDKSNRHSTHFEALTEPYLRFPQGSVPGIRQINIKSNTLERSGVGLSGSVSNIEKETQKGSNSFFKKPLFSGNFLRNNRPRPASLGTGKDFASLESSTIEADTTEKRSFFSRVARQSGPVTSVKITPKGSTEEHRKEALKKLGILKE